MTNPAYKARDFSPLIGMPGFSETMLKNHFTLYQGYVTNLNKLADIVAGKPKDATNPEYAELKRRFAFEYNGMRLHEYYFENLGGKSPLDKSGEFAKKLIAAFGSYEAWEEDFKATGKMRGVGWVVLYMDEKTGNLFNVWVAEHQDNHFAGGKLLLVMDVWEHAYMTDYQTNRAAYVDAFFKNISWDAVAARLR
jgi:Fe-Mn family superoxide dismutase